MLVFRPFAATERRQPPLGADRERDGKSWEEEMSLLGSRDEIFLEAVRVREEEMLLCLRQMPYN